MSQRRHRTVDNQARTSHISGRMDLSHRPPGPEVDRKNPISAAPGVAYRKSRPSISPLTGRTFGRDFGTSYLLPAQFLSADKNIYPNVQKNLFPVESEPGAKELHIRYHEVEPGVVEGSYHLANIESAELFAFVLENLLGHAIYL